jgi:hypothetical protein
MTDNIYQVTNDQLPNYALQQATLKEKLMNLVYAYGDEHDDTPNGIYCHHRYNTYVKYFASEIIDNMLNAYTRYRKSFNRPEYVTYHVDEHLDIVYVTMRYQSDSLYDGHPLHTITDTIHPMTDTYITLNKDGVWFDTILYTVVIDMVLRAFNEVHGTTLIRDIGLNWSYGEENNAFCIQFFLLIAI